MITLHYNGVYLVNGKPVTGAQGLMHPNEAKKNTIAYGILSAHSKTPVGDKLSITFDSLVSHDITYVGIIQSARHSGLKEFPVPYALTNCHNSLCAVGGTINEDDHAFGLSAAIKYGGIFVPPNISVIHMYAREMLSAPGKMILGSDSHTRYGALGTMGIGEGGPEIVKQLLKNTYDIPNPQVALIYVTGEPKAGVGPHDVSIALIKATFGNGFLKNKVLEFTGPGLQALPVEYRNAIDVMTTETTCLSSIWETDDKVEDYYKIHNRKEVYKKLSPGNVAYYDCMVTIDLSKIECMIALPYHPGNGITIQELLDNPKDILGEVEKESEKLFGSKLNILDKISKGNVWADQGIIAGCAGGLLCNICDADSILRDGDTGNGYFQLSIYPGSLPVYTELIKNGVMESLIKAGATFKPAFCGPCFGAGDVPANGGLSLRHTTRNFPNREGSKPQEGQLSAVALMDARSIAATAKNKGAITPATRYESPMGQKGYAFDSGIYQKRVYNGYGSPKKDEKLRQGPNITDWPKMHPMENNILMELTAVIHDDVTTTDELIPSGETSSYRSNPLRLAEYTLSRRCPGFVGLCKKVRDEETARRNQTPSKKLLNVFRLLGRESAINDTAFVAALFAKKPGDGSAREQAASCQRVLGCAANIAYDYATKRYRSNCINWGILPFTIDKNVMFTYEEGDYLFVENIVQAIKEDKKDIPANVIKKSGDIEEIALNLSPLTEDEKQIILMGGLMNFYANKNAGPGEESI